MKNTAKQFGRWVRSAALLARADVGLVVVSVGLAFPLLGCQERGNRPNADKKQADSTAPRESDAGRDGETVGRHASSVSLC